MKIVLALALLRIGASAAGSSGCLCTYGQSCWPSASTFSELQSQVSQPLIYPHPSASACYPPSDPSGNCTAVQENWVNGTWRASMPGSMEAKNFETFIFGNGTIEACFLNTTITGKCEQGSVPVIGVDARSVEDIQAAVTFAVQYGLKLVVKNTGHDYAGRSAGRDSFMVWTHNMKDIAYHSAFVPSGAWTNESFEAVTLAAGVQFSEAFEAVDNYGRLIVGGLGGSLGSSGGWLGGGGTSPLSPTYGFGADNAVEISVVLSTGEHLVTNEYQNPDLFWALRGGGGSTYGIVTCVTYRTYPSVPIHTYSYQANITNSSIALELVGGLLRFQPQFTDDGWGGFGDISSEQLRFSFFAPNLTNETAIASTEAWRNFTASLAPFGVTSADQMDYSSSWYELFQSAFSGGGGGPDRNFILTSRLLSPETIAKNYTQIAEVLVGCGAGFNMVAGGKVSQLDADSAGLTPAWRSAVGEIVCGTHWQDGVSPTEMQGLITQHKGWVKAMHDVSPNGGACFSDGSLYEIDWQESFFGSHYSTLKEIKDKYDPHRLFIVAEGVGSEDWNSDLTCRH